MSNMDIVNIFIAGFIKKYGLEVQYFFLNGGCKIFSDILVNNFEGTQWSYGDHYITEIGGKYWDVTGEIDPRSDKIKSPGHDPFIEMKMEKHSNIVELVMYELLISTNKQ